jgi:hypothetical protein
MAQQKLTDLMKAKESKDLTDYTAKKIAAEIKKRKEQMKAHGGMTSGGQEAWTDLDKD